MTNEHFDDDDGIIIQSTSLQSIVRYMEVLRDKCAYR